MARKNRDESWLADEEAERAPPEPCWLCGRPLGKTVDRFHPIPKSRGGKDTVPVHPICRETIDANFTASELVRHAESGTPLTDNETVARFVKWVSGKPADFHSATKTGR
ncbi:MULTISPECIES: HNH endonuclease [unclassified Aureimonas]|uniref:HNH endonuclease n=1 Tax=unclassified Aureimonas TaxID=2615206 RepID=UPI00071FC078|nr:MULTISPECIES: HNH endonuclease [unclassified Aureimonas]ALN75321.1 hypothetical protein M673_21535 [Aureimonas sp. AU20]